MSKNELTQTTVVRNNSGRLIEVKKIKNEYFRNSTLLAAKESDIAKSEVNDCVVRAFMSALEIPYDNAHQYVKEKLYRENKKGTYTRRYIDEIVGTQKNKKKLVHLGYHPSVAYGGKKLINPKRKGNVGYSIQSFMEQYPTGNYVIIVKGHALGLVNGVLYGNEGDQYGGLKTRVHYVIQCQDMG